LEKEIMQGIMPGARRRGRPRTAWMDNIKTWTGLPVEESVRMTEDRDIRRKYVHRVHGQPTLGSRTPNRTYKPRRYVRSGSACGGRGNGFTVAERRTVVVH